MEILPIGPVTITDTAGIDDTGELGALRLFPAACLAYMEGEETSTPPAAGKVWECGGNKGRASLICQKR
jgi:hypothetical protein